MNRRRLYEGIAVVVLILVSINVLFFYFSPREIIEAIGVENSYLITFLVAAIGGLNTFTSGVLYATIATFAAGGSIPWLIGIAGGIGIAIGDAIMFHLFKYGADKIPEKTRDWIAEYRTYIDVLPRWAQYLLIFIYVGFTPLPNDILMFALVMLKFKFWKVAPFILIGGILVATIVAYAGQEWLV